MDLWVSRAAEAWRVHRDQMELPERRGSVAGRGSRGTGGWLDPRGCLVVARG